MIIHDADELRAVHAATNKGGAIVAHEFSGGYYLWLVTDCCRTDPDCYHGLIAKIYVRDHWRGGYFPQNIFYPLRVVAWEDDLYREVTKRLDLS